MRTNPPKNPHHYREAATGKIRCLHCMEALGPIARLRHGKQATSRCNFSLDSHQRFAALCAKKEVVMGEYRLEQTLKAAPTRATRRSIARLESGLERSRERVALTA